MIDRYNLKVQCLLFGCLAGIVVTSVKADGRVFVLDLRNSSGVRGLKEAERACARQNARLSSVEELRHAVDECFFSQCTRGWLSGGAVGTTVCNIVGSSLKAVDVSTEKAPEDVAHLDAFCIKDKDMPCGDPPSFPNARLQQPSGLQMGDELLYGCLPGHAMPGGQAAFSLLCDSCGEWYGSVQICAKDEAETHIDYEDKFTHSYRDTDPDGSPEEPRDEVYKKVYGDGYQDESASEEQQEKRLSVQAEEYQEPIEGHEVEGEVIDVSRAFERPVEEGAETEDLTGHPRWDQEGGEEVRTDAAAATEEPVSLLSQKHLFWFPSEAFQEEGPPVSGDPFTQTPQRASGAQSEESKEQESQEPRPDPDEDPEDPDDHDDTDDQEDGRHDDQDLHEDDPDDSHQEEDHQRTPAQQDVIGDLDSEENHKSREDREDRYDHYDMGEHEDEREDKHDGDRSHEDHGDHDDHGNHDDHDDHGDHDDHDDHDGDHLDGSEEHPDPDDEHYEPHEDEEEEEDEDPYVYHDHHHDDRSYEDHDSHEEDAPPPPLVVRPAAAAGGAGQNVTQRASGGTVAKGDSWLDGHPVDLEDENGESTTKENTPVDREATDRPNEVEHRSPTATPEGGAGSTGASPDPPGPSDPPSYPDTLDYDTQQGAPTQPWLDGLTEPPPLNHGGGPPVRRLPGETGERGEPEGETGEAVCVGEGCPPHPPSPSGRGPMVAAIIVAVCAVATAAVVGVWCYRRKQLKSSMYEMNGKSQSRQGQQIEMQQKV
ncbi:unnamed protein product [Menidia menidia]|uniref:(Atlantic silverside) hypothetical protein n=1 Tax=Menidia menidia TaxID=238744 RepID=A0A8S4AUH5_9TELE|nr:unnamed protein product [Menidia menidia]